MKRRILAILSAVALMLSLTACANKADIESMLENNTQSTNSNVNDNNSKNTEADNNNSNNTKADDEKPKETQPEETKPEETQAEEKNNNFTHGTLNDSGYSSELFGIKAEFGSGWEVYTDDDMAEKNNISDMSEENVNKVLNESAILYEMMAGIESKSNVNIVVENLNLTAGRSLTADEYLELAVDDLRSSLKASYGLRRTVEVNIDKASLCGKEYSCIKVLIEGSGQTIKEVLIPVIKNNYAAIVTFTSLSDEDQQTLMDAFKTLG